MWAWAWIDWRFYCYLATIDSSIFHWKGKSSNSPGVSLLMNRQSSNWNWQVFALTEHDRAANGHPDPLHAAQCTNQKCVINCLEWWTKNQYGRGNGNGNGDVYGHGSGSRDGNEYEGHHFELGNKKFWRCIKLKLRRMLRVDLSGVGEGG